MGWGKQCDVGGDNCQMSPVAQEASGLEVIPDPTDEYPGDDSFWDGVFCVDTLNTNSGPCSGDTGGPLIDTANSNAVAGVFSFGSVEGCNAGKPACYASVAPYKRWIEDNLKVE